MPEGLRRDLEHLCQAMLCNGIEEPRALLNPRRENSPVSEFAMTAELKK